MRRPPFHTAAATLSFSRRHLLRPRQLQQCQPQRLNSSNCEQKSGVPVDSTSTKKDGSLGSDTTAPPSPSAPQPQPQPRRSGLGVRTEVRDWTATDAETYQPGGNETIQITRIKKRDSIGTKIQKKAVIQTRLGSPAFARPPPPPPTFTPSEIVALRNVGTTLTPAELYSLSPRNVLLPGFESPQDIIHVTPYRDPQTLVRRAIYHLEFKTPLAAATFAREADSYDTSIFPPGTKPTYVHLKVKAPEIGEQRALEKSIGPRGKAVLLTAIGPGGETARVRLPRSSELMTAFHEEGIEVRPGTVEERWKSKGVSRNFWKAEKWWVVKCASEREAQLIVRRWHMRRWRDGVVLLRAEVM